MAVTVQVAEHTFTPDPAADGDFVINSVVSNGGWTFVIAGCNANVGYVNARKTGANQVSGRVLRESGDQIVKPAGQVTVTFACFTVT